MTREDAIETIKIASAFNSENSPLTEAIQMAIADMEKQIQWEKTEKFNRMIEAFECDFALIENGSMTFAELDKIIGEEVHGMPLKKDMELMQELSYLIRHGKAEIWLKEGE